MRSYIRQGHRKTGHVCSNTGQVYKGLQNVGRVDAEGNVYDGFRKVGYVTDDGKIYRGMRKIAELNQKGDVLVNLRKVGSITPHDNNTVLQHGGAALLVLL